MRGIKKIHKAVEAPIEDLVTFRGLPTNTLDHIDPFLFLNHHGPQVYPPNNHGLPFGPHPHRGFETLTFIFEGDLMHWDSGGGKSVINAGGIQWMTAGRGLVHAEISSEEFMKKGGKIEIIQLWFNLPSYLKMIEPRYTGKQENEIPHIFSEDKLVKINPVSGKWNNHSGPVESMTGIEIASLEFKEGAKYKILISEERNILFYVVRGKVEVNDQLAEKLHLVEFGHNEKLIEITALEDSLILLGHGMPFNEPIVAQGPFVMNSTAEIRQAWLDYQQGEMGSEESFL
jgi:quercetin 2,3-dioxygenase